MFKTRLFHLQESQAALEFGRTILLSSIQFTSDLVLRSAIAGEACSTKDLNREGCRWIATNKGQSKILHFAAI
jgi:hypothetical protein